MILRYGINKNSIFVLFSQQGTALLKINKENFMSISKEFDLAIKLAETKTIDGEYSVGERKYNTYMTND